MAVAIRRAAPSTRLERLVRRVLLGLLGLALAACAASRNPVSDWQNTEALHDQAVAGDAESQYRLGMHYLNGRGVLRNETKAATWFTHAAETGHADAQFMLATAYATGRGVAPDPARALVWYRKAAEVGQPRAQSQLGDAYMHGRDVPKDRMWGARWTGMAAEQGLATAQFQLAALHSHGLGVPSSWFTATVWLRRAELGGHPQAARGLETARQNLSGSQYEAALAQAERWTPTPGLHGHENRPTLVYAQHALNRLGYAAGYPDGVLGPKTRAAMDRLGVASAGDLDKIIQALRPRTPDLE